MSGSLLGRDITKKTTAFLPLHDATVAVDASRRLVGRRKYGPRREGRCDDAYVDERTTKSPFRVTFNGARVRALKIFSRPSALRCHYVFGLNTKIARAGS